ncbi:hypothetical protein BK673_27090 [Pseudomonas fluorescens]|uniref:Adenylate kinase n=2 Tax=Pseudomonas fluorescens TaxID=294 RepID=A0A423NVP7_PSEFL|nr:hypothetical protein BK673_27090 [Pseudomonas fluorescens]
MMIFIVGVYGVGKTTICKVLASSFDYIAVSASELIRRSRGEVTWDGVKRTRDISTNQHHLIQAVNSLQGTNKNIILDGHFALLDGAGNIIEVDIDVFFALNIDVVLLIEDQPAEILARLNLRDSAGWELSALEKLLIAEREGAFKFHRESGVPIKVFQSDDLQSIMKFISSLENSNKE